MNINDFETKVTPIIVQQGSDYFAEGHILKLLGTPNGRFAATVSGTDEYEVDCKLNEAGDILYSYCTCSDDQEPICKHEVAFFLALRENSSHLEWKDELPNDLRRSLMSLSHQELVTLFLSMTAEDDELYDTLKKRLFFR